MKAIYVTQRVYDECYRNTFGAKQTDTRVPTVAGNIFIGIPVFVSDFVPDPPGFLGVNEDGVILYPTIHARNTHLWQKSKA